MKDDFRQTLCTVDRSGRRKWVYPVVVPGRYRRIRTGVAVVLLLVYLLAPWIQIGGNQALRVDVLGRKLTFLGATFQATDTFYLFLFLGVLAFTLFLVTAVVGRVWCGWACPETVFLEFVFRPLERLIEGDVARRKQLDAAPFSTGKFLRKATKYVVFAAIAWILASTALAVFVGKDELLQMMGHSPSENPELFALTVALMGLLLFQFGWFREQFCTVLCPYARFQSVLLDSQSLAVTYDTERGEPRGKHSNEIGCVDCKLCVKTCPTGIDIRDGLQLECIQCTACMDACNSIMVRLGRPEGLIRYSSEHAIAGKPSSIVRPRTALYALILLAYCTTLAVSLYQRPSAEFQVVRALDVEPFVVAVDGTITNHFTLRLVNNSSTDANFTVKLLQAPSLEVVVPLSPFKVVPAGLGELPLFVRFPKHVLREGRATVSLEVQSDGHSVGRVEIPLIGPDV